MSLPVKMLILSKLSVDGFATRDTIDEGQLFYNEYCRSSTEYTLKNGKKLYYCAENGIAVTASSVGKMNVSSHLATVLCDDRFDFSAAYLLGVGCGGAAVGTAIFGDVVLAAASIDLDIGHTADYRDMRSKDPDTLWFNDPICNKFSHVFYNASLIDTLYAAVKDTPLQTTEIAERTLQRNFAGEAWAARKPKVLIGTTLTSDNYWKGEFAHATALRAAAYYRPPAPFAIAEMEDAAIGVVARQFGLLDRTIILRGAVNMDTFLDGECPETLWAKDFKFSDAVRGENAETLDVFVPTMQNVFRVGSSVIARLC